MLQLVTRRVSSFCVARFRNAIFNLKIPRLVYWLNFCHKSKYTYNLCTCLNLDIDIDKTFYSVNLRDI